MHLNCTNTHCCPGVAALHPGDNGTATSAPQPSARDRIPPCMNLPAEPFPSRGCWLRAQTPNPSVSDGPNWLKPCGNHPQSTQELPTPFRGLLKALKALAQHQTHQMGDPRISSLYRARQHTQSCPQLPSTLQLGNQLPKHLEFLLSSLH